MTWWSGTLISVAAVGLIWAGFVAVFYLVGRRTEVGAISQFIPDCVILLGRLLRDHRVPRRRKLLVVALLGYLAMPFDLIPDFIPVAGQLDDVIVVILVLRTFFRRSNQELLAEHWPGPPASLSVLRRAVGG